MADAELRNAGKYSRSEAFVILRECTLRRLALSDCFIVAGARVWVLHGAVICKHQKWSLADALIVFLPAYSRRHRLVGRSVRDLDIPPQQFGTMCLIGSVQPLAALGRRRGSEELKAMAYLAIISWVDCFVAYVLRKAQFGR
jgi:hypothetical protein